MNIFKLKMDRYLEKIKIGEYIHYSSIKNKNYTTCFVIVEKIENVYFDAIVKSYTSTSLLPNMREKVIVVKKINNDYYVVLRKSGYFELLATDDLIMPSPDDGFFQTCTKKKHFPILMPDMV